jgi:P4 family phage/plasmid primase-like protien
MNYFSQKDVNKSNLLAHEHKEQHGTDNQCEHKADTEIRESTEKLEVDSKTALQMNPVIRKDAATADKVSVRNIDLSHDALAQRLGIAYFNECARFIPGSNRWYFWDSKRWKSDDTLRHLSKVRDFLRAEAKGLTKQASQEAKGMKEGAAASLMSWAKTEARTLRSRATISAVASLVQANWGIAMAQADFDLDPLLLATPKGTVDLRTGSLMPARQEDMITKLTFCGPAKPGSSPKLWLRFLHQIFDGNQEVIDFMQRAAGYALTGLTDEHKLLFLHGSGRNGKSVFLNTLNLLLGDYARSASSSLLLVSGQNQHPTALAGLQGARLVIASEIPKNATWNEAMIKDITGGEALSARYMRGDFFEFKPQMTLMIAGNDKPRLNGVDKAMRARIVLVPFEVFIPPEDRDPFLTMKLEAEGPEILRWAIEGALEWQKRGLDVPEAIKKASLAYLDDEDVLQSFLDEETISSSSNCVKTQDLYDRYRGWCQQQGIQAEKRKYFTNDLKARGFQEVKRSTGLYFLGLNFSELSTD